jgi:uncharacterized protein (DUF885 family)
VSRTGIRALLAAALLTAAVPASAQPAPQPSAQASADAAFETLARTYLAEYEVRDPLFADGIGVHDYDDRLPDYSAKGLAAREGWQKTWRTRVEAVAPASLSPGGNADRTALLDSIELELFEDGTIDPWRTNPAQYVEAIGSACYDMTSRTYAPVDARYSALAARLTELPGLAQAAMDNLTRPPRVVTDYAIEQNAGNVSFYRDDLPKLAEAASPAVRAKIAARLPAVVAALERLQAFLKGPLLARSDGNTRVGAEVFDRELVLADGIDVPRETLVARARAAMAAQRAQMLQLALPLDKQFFPAASREGSGDELIDRVVGRVLKRLSDDHPARDAVFATAKDDLVSIEAFLTKDPVVCLPVPSTLHVAPTPAFLAGFGGASFDGPGPFSPMAEGYYYIDEIPASWSPERVASYLREYNDYEMKMLTIHEAVPGHYVQSRYNNALPSIVRRVFGNGSFVEGWAVWCEGMMLDAGYGDGDPRLRLFQLKWRLREEANAVIDAEYHAGTLTEAQLYDFLEQQAFQEHAEAQTKWHRLQVSHDQLSSYFAGLDAIQSARAATQGRYDLAAFNQRLLDIGDVEPRFIASLI